MTPIDYLIAFGLILVVISFFDFFYLYHQDITYRSLHPNLSKISWIPIISLFIFSLIELILLAFLIGIYYF